MKAISECRWEVTILNTKVSRFWWTAYTSDDCNLELGDLTEEDSHETLREAIDNWKEFAEKNNITKYTFGE